LDVSVWRSARNATEVDFLNAKGISSSEGRSHVVEATHIVEHQDEGRFFGFFILLNGQPLELFHA
jgi:hypothetical protein